MVSETHILSVYLFRVYINLETIPLPSTEIKGWKIVL